jgi:hypothetical protein
MIRMPSMCALAIAVAACGGNGNGSGGGGGNGSGRDGGNGDGSDGSSDGGDRDAGVDAPRGLVYTDPSGGALRLVANPRATATAMVLDFIVGDAPLTGFSTGFDLPLDTSKVTMGPFTPGSALDPGTAPRAAAAVIADQGPLRGMLVIGQSQKAGGAGAVPTDTVLAPRTVLYTVEIDLVEPPHGGVVFDGTVSGFVLPSGGLRNKAGITVVEASQVKIGKLEVRP